MFVLFVSFFFFFRVSIYLWVLDGEYNGASQASRNNIGEGPYGHAFLHIKQLFSIYSPSRTPDETSWLPYLAHSHTQETKGHIRDCHIHPMSGISFPRPDHPSQAPPKKSPESTVTLIFLLSLSSSSLRLSCFLPPAPDHNHA